MLSVLVRRHRSVLKVKGPSNIAELQTKEVSVEECGFLYIRPPIHRAAMQTLLCFSFQVVSVQKVSPSPSRPP